MILQFMINKHMQPFSKYRLSFAVIKCSSTSRIIAAAPEFTVFPANLSKVSLAAPRTKDAVRRCFPLAFPFPLLHLLERTGGVFRLTGITLPTAAAFAITLWYILVASRRFFHLCFIAFRRKERGKLCFIVCRWVMSFSTTRIHMQRTMPSAYTAACHL